MIVNVTTKLPVPSELVALTVAAYIPADDGMPEIRPVVEFTDNPGGRPIALKLVGLLVAVI